MPMDVLFDFKLVNLSLKVTYESQTYSIQYRLENEGHGRSGRSPQRAKDCSFLGERVWCQQQQEHSLHIIIETYITCLINYFFMQAMQNVMSSSCVTFRPKVAEDLDWMSITTTGVSGCFAYAQ
jgi:hypothetical protein